MTTYEEFTARTKEMVESIGESFDKDGDWLPVAFTLDEQDRFTINGMMVDPDLYPVLLLAIGKEQKPLYIATVLSSWASLKDWTELQLAQARKAGWQPQHDLNRREVLMLAIADHEHEVWWEADIIRSDTDVKLKKWKRMKGEIGGRQPGSLMAACKIWR